MDTSLIVLLCVVGGGVANTVTQFFSAILRATEPVKFDQKYAASFGLSMIATVFAALGVFMAIPIPPDVPVVYVAIPGALSGYAINNIANLGVDTYANRLQTKIVNNNVEDIEKKPSS